MAYLNHFTENIHRVTNPNQIIPKKNYYITPLIPPHLKEELSKYFNLIDYRYLKSLDLQEYFKKIYGEIDSSAGAVFYENSLYLMNSIEDEKKEQFFKVCLKKPYISASGKLDLNSSIILKQRVFLLKVHINGRLDSRVFIELAFTERKRIEVSCVPSSENVKVSIEESKVSIEIYLREKGLDLLIKCI